MKYRSRWPTFILRANVRSYWFIIPNNDVHTSNSLQDTRQNHWTIKYRSQWPTFIRRSNLWSYRFIIPKYDVHRSNSLQDIRQNHWTVKFRSCWPSVHDPQVNVTRLSHVWPTICVSCFHNREVEKHFLKVSYILTSSPTLEHGPWGQESWIESQPSRVPIVQVWMLAEASLMRTNNIYFYGEIWKIISKLWSNTHPICFSACIY